MSSAARGGLETFTTLTRRPFLVARLTKREWAIRIVALLIAFSFVSTLFYSFFEAV